MNSFDDVVLELAARQHGAFARWQLRAAGFAGQHLSERLRTRRFIRRYRGVFSIGALTSRWTAEVAAALAYGPGAVVSHATSASVYALASRNAGAPLAVSVDGGHPRARAGIRLYRVTLPESDRTTFDGVPITTPSRTLIDLASVASPRMLEQAVAAALRRPLCDEAALTRHARRQIHRAGARRLLALLQCATPPALTRSEAEERFLALVRQMGVPAPLANVRVCNFEVDFHWPAAKLVVEIDGAAFHTSRTAQQRDRNRDTVLAAAGYRVLRFTWFDVTERAVATSARLAEALARQGDVRPGR